MSSALIPCASSLHIRFILHTHHIYLPPSQYISRPTSIITMSDCIWNLSSSLINLVLFACYFFSSFFSWADFVCVHHYPPLAFIFGFGIYGMQACIEKHFVHISSFGFVLGVYMGGDQGAEFLSLSAMSINSNHTDYYSSSCSSVLFSSCDCA